MGDHFVTTLCLMKHNGAIDKTQSGFTALCERWVQGVGGGVGVRGVGGPPSSHSKALLPSKPARGIDYLQGGVSLSHA